MANVSHLAKNGFLKVSYIDRAAPGNQAAAFKGLVLAGGRSTRMKQDKAILEYHGQSQVGYVFHLLRKFCNEVFISCRAEQAEEAAFKNFPQIHDRFIDLGPLAGIFSAFYEFSDSAWLVLACDLPFVDEETLSYLIEKRNPRRLATAYQNPPDGLPEPLCTIYEAGAYLVFQQYLAQGCHSPRQLLIDSAIERLNLKSPHKLTNINYPEEYAAAKMSIQIAANKGIAGVEKSR